MSVTYEPTAAERIRGNKQCQYQDCEDPADWIVEVNHGSLIYCCDSCGRRNRLHPYDVEENEVTAHR